VQQLSSQALETQASVDALKKERATLEEFRTQLRASQSEIKQSVDHASTLRAELDQVRAHRRASCPRTTPSCATPRARRRKTRRRDRRREGRRKAPRPADQAAGAEQDHRGKAHLAQRARRARHQKAKALEAQKHTIDARSSKPTASTRWSGAWTSRSSKLSEALKQAARSEERLQRIEKLVAETNAQVDAATKVRDEFAREAAASRRTAAPRRDVAHERREASLEKKEFESFDQRLRVAAVSVARRRPHGSLAAKEKHLRCSISRRRAQQELPA
jgi:hypothetical protein